MKNFLYLFALITCIGLSTTSRSLAQGVTTAAMNGVVVDEKGVPMPGATVVAVHVPSGTKYGYSTRDNGDFNFPAVRTGGPYTITVSFIGYKQTVINDITLSLGQDLDLNIEMKPSGVDLNEIVVSGKRDRVFNSDRTGASNVMNNKQISEMPTLTRSFNDVTRLTPQGSGNGNFAGRNNLYNNLSIDGSVFNNVFGLGQQPGGQTNAQPISLDAIEEVQVSLAPYDVRQSGFTGAGINAITRSGTNEIKASVYSFIRTPGMVSTKVGEASVSNDFQYNQSGFRVGAPIIKDKLFFFVNAEIERREDPANTYLASRSGNTGDNIAKVNASDLDDIRSLLIKNYKFDPGTYENYRLKTYNDKFIVRLDYNINQNNKLSVRYNYLRSWKDANPSGGSGSSTFLAFSNSTYKINNNIHSLVAELNSTFGKSLSNNFIAGYTAFNDYRETGTPQFPYVEIYDGSGTKMTAFGYERYTANNKLNTNVYQISDNLSYYLGKHTITAGAAFEYNQFENGFMQDYNGYYRYNSLADFKNDVNHIGTNNARVFSQQYSAVKGDTAPIARLNVAQLGVFLQDEYKPNKQLKLTYGLRVDLPFYPSSLQSNPALESLTFKDGDGNDEKLDVGKLPKITPLFSPRLGFNYDVFGDRSTQIRGGTGLFTGKIPFVWISNQASNNGMLFYTINADKSNSKTPLATTPYPFTNDVTKYVGGTPVNTFAINVTSNNFKFPQVFRSNLAVDQKLPFGIVATLEGIYSKDYNSVYLRNDNISITDYTTLPDGRPRYKTSTSNSRVTAAYVLDNTNEGYSYSGTAQLQKTFDFGLNLLGSYTYSETKDISSNPGSTASSAFGGNYVTGNPNKPSLQYSNYDQPHKLVFCIGYKVDYLKMFSTSINLLYTGIQSGRYSYTYGNDLNGDGVSNNDLIYVPKDQSDINLVKDSKNPNDTRTIPELWNQLNAYIEQDAYLSKHRGEILPRNHSITPWVNRFDIKFTQDFYLNVAGKRNTLEFTLDIINAGNLLNSDWGVVKSVNKNSFLNYAGMDSNGKPTFSFPYFEAEKQKPLTSTYSNFTGIDSRWQIQLGVRYTFN